MGTGAGWVKHRLNLTLPDAGRCARAFIKSIIDFGGPLGAPAIIGSMQGRSSDGSRSGDCPGRDPAAEASTTWGSMRASIRSR